MTKAELVARVEHLERRVAVLERPADRGPSLVELHVEVLRRLRLARAAGDLVGCRRLRDMLSRIAAKGEWQ